MLDFLGDSLHAWLLVAGMAVICWVLLRRWGRYYRRRNRDDGTRNTTSRPPSGAASHSRPSPAAEDFQRWEVAMQQTAREMTAKLDSKISILQTLIQQAEATADRLESLRHTSGDPSVEMTGNQALANHPDTSLTDKVCSDIHMLALYGYSVPQIAGRLGLSAERVASVLGRVQE